MTCCSIVVVYCCLIFNSAPLECLKVPLLTHTLVRKVTVVSMAPRLSDHLLWETAKSLVDPFGNCFPGWWDHWTASWLFHHPVLPIISNPILDGFAYANINGLA